jgi:hypothetical protein
LIKANLRSVIKPLLIIAAVVLLVNLGHFSRNISIFSNPLQSGEISYSNESFTPASLISNISRNMALHMGTPWNRANALTERVIEVLHTILNKDSNDPKTTYANTSFKVTKASLFEDRAGNALHLLLILFSIVVLLSDKQLRSRSSHLTGFFCALIGGFLLFCFYLKWQPWGSRLHLPLFVLWAPFVAVVLSKARYQYSINSIAVFCLIVHALGVVMRPGLFGDKSQYSLQIGWTITSAPSPGQSIPTITLQQH